MKSVVFRDSNITKQSARAWAKFTSLESVNLSNSKLVDLDVADALLQPSSLRCLFLDGCLRIDPNKFCALLREQKKSKPTAIDFPGPLECASDILQWNGLHYAEKIDLEIDSEEEFLTLDCFPSPVYICHAYVEESTLPATSQYPITGLTASSAYMNELAPEISDRFDHLTYLRVKNVEHGLAWLSQLPNLRQVVLDEIHTSNNVEHCFEPEWPPNLSYLSLFSVPEEHFGSCAPQMIKSLSGLSRLQDLRLWVNVATVTNEIQDLLSKSLPKLRNLLVSSFHEEPRPTLRISHPEGSERSIHGVT